MLGPALVDIHALAKAQRTDHVLFGTHRLRGVVSHLLVGTHALNTVDQPAQDVSAAGFYLSGGLSNIDPNQALGGQISTEQLQFQSFIQKTTLPGVTINRIGNSGLGTGVLRYEPWESGYVFRWIPRGADATFGRLVYGDGEYGVLTANGVGTGFAIISVAWDSLTPGLVEAEVDVTNIFPNLFSNLTPAQAETGIISYRCLFIKNERVTGTMSGLVLSTFKSGNTGTEVQVGVDPAGVGNGVSTGVATTPASETTDPGMAFSDSVNLPDITPGDCLAVWFRRTVPAGWYKELSPDVHLLLMTGGF